MKRLLAVLTALILALGAMGAGAEAPAEEAPAESAAAETAAEPAAELKVETGAALPAEGDVVEGFEVLKVRDFSAFGATVVLFEHQKTGAGLTYIANGDTNRAFDLTFFTRPIDNSGLLHVFEHATLDGSDKWPSKTLFFNVVYQTYNTFMNAMTNSAYTTFPVASLSEAQLLKLAEYYTDLCLHPMVMTDESIFREEAWRYRMASLEDDLTIEGTVYTEMQGAVNLARMAMQNALSTTFPGAAAGLQSGGLPENIPEMTWEGLKDYHNRFYHPSNCMAYLYGQFDDYTAFLKQLDEAFASYEKAEVNYEDQNYTPITGPVEVSFGFPTEAGSGTELQSQAYYYLVCPGLKDDPQEELLMKTLTDLLKSGASPVMARLQKVLPSASFASYIELNGPEDAIGFIALNINPEDAVLFRDAVNEGLAEVAEKGFSQELVDSAMTSVALSTKLATEDSSAGVNLINTFAGMMAVRGDPLDYMDYVEGLSKLNEWNSQGLYQEAVKKWLIGNELTTLTTTYPEPGLKEQKDAETAAKLAEIKAGMTDEEKQAIVDATNAAEPEEDNAEMIAGLKAVTVASLPEEIRTYEIADETGADGVRRMNVTAGVDGVGQVVLLLDAKGLPQESIHYFHLFAELTGLLDTTQHTKEELDLLISRYLYNPEIRLSLMPSPTEEYQPRLKAAWVALDDDLEMSYSLISELLYETRYDDPQKLLEKVSGLKAAVRSEINGKADTMAVQRYLGANNPMYRYYSFYNYVEYYQFLEQVEALLAENPEAVTASLQQVQEYFRNRTGAVAYFAGNENSIALNRPLADAFFAKLDARPVEHVTYDLPAPAAREGLIIDSAVQFNALTATYDQLGLEGFDASLVPLLTLVSDVYLMPLLRDQYGVYTPESGCAPDAGVYLVTYRDPNIKETFGVYDSLADLMAETEINQETLDGYILSSYSSYSRSTGELAGAYNAVTNILQGKPQDINITYMKQLKTLTPEKVKASAEMFRKLSENGTRGTVGSASAINANADLYDAVLNPFNAKDLSKTELTDVPEGSEHYEAVIFVMANGLMAPLSEDTFGVAENATDGDLMAAVYTVTGGAQNAPEEARAFLAGYGIVPADLDLSTELNEQFLCDLLAAAFGQQVLTTDTPDAIVTRGDLADLFKMLFDAPAQQ